MTSVQTVTVLGSGTMGHGIAQVCAQAGLQTRLFDLSNTAVEQAMQRIQANLDKGVARQKLAPDARERALGHLTPHTELASASEAAELIIEAVPERLDLKAQVLREASKHASNNAILATNTSSLSVAALARELPEPSRVIGTHFFNPVHIMKLLEVIIAPETDPQVVQSVLAFGRTIGKECIQIQDSPGFATSRLGLVIGLEAIRMVEQGVGTPEDIDKAMTLGYGFPMGPLRLTDLVGLDVRLAIAEYLAEALPMGQHFQPPQLLRQMVSQGKLGKKAGQGFYAWPKG